MTEVLFYQLERQPLDQVLVKLLTATLSRGNKAVVQAGSPERVAALDSHLWTYSEESFLPHGTASETDANLQPVVLTHQRDNPNGPLLSWVSGEAARQNEAGFRTVRER